MDTDKYRGDECALPFLNRPFCQDEIRHKTEIARLRKCDAV